MTEFADKPGYAFDTGPPPEVMRYFQGRQITPSFSFLDVEPEEHAVQFAVAKAMQIDVLQAIKEELERAAAEGLTYETFRSELTPRLKKLGWWGVKDAIDPDTGEAVKARMGSPRRLRTIWRANMRSAHAAGQWDRIQRTKRALPYLVYLLGPSREHRVEHEVKEGLVYPIDHPFWDEWFPPNGWGCNCHVRQITEREAQRRGISEEPTIERRKYRNPRTGEVRDVPRGVDPAWAGNPGKRRAENAASFLAARLDGAPPEIARAAAIDLAMSWRAARIHEGSVKGDVPIAMLTEQTAKRLGASTRVVRYSDEAAARSGDQPFGAIRGAQAAFEGADVFADVDGLTAFQSLDGRLWRFQVRSEADGRKVQLLRFGPV